MFNQQYLPEECALIHADFEAGTESRTTAAKLNLLPCNLFRAVIRNGKGVRLQRMSLGLKRYTANNNAVPEDPAARDLQNRHADDAFQAMMHEAAQAGAERVRFGVFKDPTPLLARTFHAEPRFSGCSSSAALCAEMAGVDGIGTSGAHA